MRFLIDNQLPRALARLLTDLGHEAVHVLDIGFAQRDDRAIWTYAGQNDYVIVSKDSDFANLALLDPRRVRFVWVRIRNCRKFALLQAFKDALATIEQQLDAGENFIELY